MKILFVKLLFRLNLLHYFNFTVLCKRNGGLVKVPIIKTLGLGNVKLSEAWMCEVLKILLPLKKGCFIDIGVNLGQSLIKRKLTDISIPYVGFDPNPVCIFYTGQLIRENNFHNAVLVPVGVSSQNELVELNYYTDGDSDSSASIVKGLRPNRQIFRQEFVPCFEYGKIKLSISHDQITIVKIDVEGAELEVLQGIRQLLESKRPFILIEILPVYAVKFSDRWNRQQKLEEIVKELDYKIYCVIKSNDQFVKFEQMDTIGVSQNIDLSDYLLCPEEYSTEIGG